MRLEEIATRLSCTLEGDGNVEIASIATLESAKEGDISFLANPKYFAEARRTKASALIVDQACPDMGRPLLRHNNPYLAFAKAIEIFHSPLKESSSIHPTAWISDSAKIGRNVSIGAFTYIGDNAIIGECTRIREHCKIHRDVIIGEYTLIHSGVVIREAVQIGSRCIIQDNAVIGSDGFGYAKQGDGGWYKIFQAGTVIVEDDVEIGAGTTIDRASLGQTVVHRGAKIDNLVQVGHACVIGSDSLICAQVGLAGSTKTGKDVILAGQVGSAGHLVIGDGVIATGQTGIPGSVEPGTIISGSPAIENKNWLKSIAVFAKLPQVQKTVRELERRVRHLENS